MPSGRNPTQILDFCSLKGDPETVLSELSSRIGEAPEMEHGMSELHKLRDILQGFRKLDRCIYDFGIVRGIGYYDGIVFEAYDRSVEGLGSVFGGGRYDGLCGIYGKRTMPATGLAGGIERLMLSLEQAGLYPKLKKTPEIFVVAVNAEMQPKVWEIVAKLRSAGIETDFDLKGRSLQGQLQYADSMDVPYAVIVGPREVEKGLLTLRQMESRKEESLSIEELIARVS